MFRSENSRTKLAIKNIFGSLLVKGGSVLISLMVVPLTINYVNATQYGIWLALSSIIAWFSLFDIGLGNGLKNKLAEALANEDTKMAKIYVSTTYAILFLLVLLFITVFLIADRFVQWSTLLSLPAEMEAELRQLIKVVFIFFCLQFIFQTIVVILTAHQNVSTASLLVFLGNLLSLVCIYILAKFSQGSLFYLGVVFSVTPIIVYIIASVFLFKTSYQSIMPSFRTIDFKHSKSLMGLGIKFFIIQIAAVFLFQTTNVILVKMFGPDEVTSYNISYKYFGIITMIFSIVMAPFWVAFSDAYYKNDVLWIKETVRKLLKIWLLVSSLGCLMLLVSSTIINFWVGETVKYSLTDGFAMLLFFMTTSFGSIFVFFVNGTGKVLIQFIISLAIPFLFIPLAIYLGRHFGQSGVIYASVICNFYGIVIAPIQYYKLVNRKATGIWDK